MVAQKGGLPSSNQVLRPDDKQSDIVLFISFDLVNSTRYKTNNAGWIKVFEDFYETAQHNLESTIQHDAMKLWKLQGDEVLFSCTITESTQLTNYITQLAEVAQIIRGNLRSQELGLKTTAWAALIDGERNIRIPTKENASPLRENDIRDYIGTSIDEGFRVSGAFAKYNRFALSFDLTWLLCELDKRFYDRIYCVGFEQLKGIWNDRYYPGLWYTERFSEDMACISYDLEHRCHLTREYQHERRISKELCGKIATEICLGHLTQMKDILSG